MQRLVRSCLDAIPTNGKKKKKKKKIIGKTNTGYLMIFSNYYYEDIQMFKLLIT